MLDGSRVRAEEDLKHGYKRPYHVGKHFAEDQAEEQGDGGAVGTHGVEFKSAMAASGWYKEPLYAQSVL
jgi:hypothetical protein